jgi:hypothetical protein
MGNHLARLVLLALALALGGCSLLYDPDRLPPAADAHIPPVLDRAALMLADVAPAMVYEGQGDGGSHAAIVVIRGKNIASDATLEITSATTPATGKVMITPGTPTIATDFSVIAVPVTIPVQALSTDVPLNIKVVQPLGDGSTTESSLDGKLTLRGLPELTSVTLTSGSAKTEQLKDLYSMIALSAPVTWSGANRVQLRAVSSITVDNITATGGAANGTTAGSGGPGGCAGGPAAASGACDGGGGAGGSMTTAAGGGGGAGFYRAGAPGTGTGAGAAGKRVGDLLLATFEGFGSFTANKASGGGGGGGSLLGSAGAGGGGGGTVELTAEGDVRAKAIAARGGAGANSAAVTQAGSGGGGAGGAVMLRAGGVLEVTSVDVTGGPGGTVNPVGGDGSPGRVRWDAVGSTPPTSVAPQEIEAHRGPAFMPLASPVVSDARTMFTLVGTTNDTFQIYVVDHEGIQHLGATGTFSNGMSTFEVPLQRGYNRVCVTLQGGLRGTSEADKCTEVAFLP